MLTYLRNLFISRRGKHEQFLLIFSWLKAKVTWNFLRTISGIKQNMLSAVVVSAHFQFLKWNFRFLFGLVESAWLGATLAFSHKLFYQDLFFDCFLLVIFGSLNFSMFHMFHDYASSQQVEVLMLENGQNNTFVNPKHIIILIAFHFVSDGFHRDKWWIKRVNSCPTVSSVIHIKKSIHLILLQHLFQS